MRTGLARADAQDDFDRALRRARWATLAGWLHGRSSSRLLVLGNETIIIGAADRDVAVPIDHIVGSVEPTRCFDRHFRPTSRLPRTRFERIAADIYCGRGMDPVDLYQCGDQYYVLDGHHRVAVARALRQRWVLANITQVRRKSPGGGPGLRPDGAPPAAHRAAAGLARRGRARELPKLRVCQRLQFGLQFTAVPRRSGKSGLRSWSSLNRSGQSRPELLMRLGSRPSAFESLSAPGGSILLTRMLTTGMADLGWTWELIADRNPREQLHLTTVADAGQS